MFETSYIISNKINIDDFPFKIHTSSKPRQQDVPRSYTYSSFEEEEDTLQDETESANDTAIYNEKDNWDDYGPSWSNSSYDDEEPDYNSNYSRQQEEEESYYQSIAMIDANNTDWNTYDFNRLK